MAAVGLNSVVPAVFWPTPRAEVNWAKAMGCEAGLRTLRDDLLNRAAILVTTGHPAFELDSPTWLRTWDDRYLALSTLCRGKGAEAHDLLGRLRYRLEPQLSRFERDLAKLHDELTRSLDALSDERARKTSP